MESVRKALSGIRRVVWCYNGCIRLLSAIYVAVGFYTLIYVVRLLVVWNGFSYEAGVDRLIGMSKDEILTYRHIGSDPPELSSLFSTVPGWLHVFGVLLFLAIFFLPEISLPVERRFGSEHITWRRGLAAGLISSVFCTPIFMVPVWRLDLLPVLLLVTAFFGVLVGYYQVPLKPDYLANHSLSAETKRRLLSLEVDKSRQVAMLLFPFMIALAFGALLSSLGFSTPLEAQDGRLVGEKLRYFLTVRGTAVGVTCTYVTVGIAALLLNISLRSYIAYKEMKSLLLLDYARNDYGTVQDSVTH